MHENNFEKKVREKMDQLGFDPPDTVWTGVQKVLNKDRKRRRPLFWLFFFFGLGLAGGGYYIISNWNSSNSMATTKQQTEAGINKEGEALNKAEMNKEEYRNENKASKISFEADNEKSTKKENVQIGKGKKNSLPEPKVNLQDHNKKIALKEKEEITLKYTVSEKREDADTAQMEQKRNETEKNKAGGNVIDSFSGKKMTVISANTASKKDSVSDKQLVRSENRAKKSSAWKWGFNIGAGISNINQSLFKPAVVRSSYLFPAGSTGNSAGPAGMYATSDISSGLSFEAGVFMSRHFSDRISISAGLNYHYYSTDILTGNAVDSSVIIYYSSAQSTPVNGIYRNGNSNTYTNQYHFIEMPFTINFQLNKSRKTPVIWEGGFSLSYLVYSNALHFDPATNVYYKNSQLFNRTQLSLVTAILIGVPIHNYKLQLGPQFQYGLTELLNGSAGNPEHLIYGGIKISIGR